uniref:Putative peptidase n=1 Tax=viral metagenome TaxID=1070528 RepID=A0A6M3IXT7_9ZZZZ
MPNPRSGESKKSYMARCQKYVIEKEGEKPDRAYKKCEGMWDQHKKKQRQKKSEAGNMLQSILSENAWLMEPNALYQFMIQVHQNLEFKEENIKPEMFGILIGGDDDNDKKPYRMDGSIAIIEIRGPLIKRASGFLAFLFGITGMEAIGNSFKKALTDSDVKGIFLDTDSPGGTSDGTMDLAEIIFNARGQKPILSFADGHMTSAAQWIGSSADYVVAANEITSMGSIGVYGVHLDYADRAKEMGIKPTVFHAGKYKAIGNQFEHLSKDDKEYVQAMFDYSHTQFVNGISKNIGIPVGELDSDLKEAKIFMGSQAIAVGLANEIMSRDQAMALLHNVAEGKTSFDKHKTEMNQITFEGGVHNMDQIQEMKLKIEGLESKLSAAQTLIAEMTDNNKKADFETKIADLIAEKDGLIAKVTALETSEAELKDQINTLKAEATANEVFLSAGKAHIEGLKSSISKLSVQVDGSSFDQGLLDKQLAAFGNDIESLNKFKVSLESRRDKMVLSGQLDPDEKKGEQGDKKTDAQQYEIGTKLVPAHLRVVKS